MKEEPCNISPDAGKPPHYRKSVAVRTGDSDRRHGKGRGSSQHAKSGLMGDETAYLYHHPVMQFPYHDCLRTPLDTPGHEDFRRYHRTPTAVDRCLMVIDAAKVLKTEM